TVFLIMGPLLGKEIISFFKPEGTSSVTSEIMLHEDMHLFAPEFLFEEFKKIQKARQNENQSK
ncbi:MAG: hypothetical protein OEY18_19095, partial [Candidatus Aminicenantes bacterium]|nr:hypothetical protein [Candidatus Aminicenantes bacterium]